LLEPENDERRRERGGDEREKADRLSLAMIILTHLLVLCRQVYSILSLFFFDSQYKFHRKCSNDFFSQIFYKYSFKLVKLLVKNKTHTEKRLHICVRVFTIVDACRVIITKRIIVRHPFIDCIFN